ncbi:hypothetical protein HDU97_004053 [Phlyctochytrium planicorne]|nr:hypothetical protein HDU97_004053 [Phlyctochytrium planicorne]
MSGSEWENQGGDQADAMAAAAPYDPDAPLEDDAYGYAMPPPPALNPKDSFENQSGQVFQASNDTTMADADGATAPAVEYDPSTNGYAQHSQAAEASSGEMTYEEYYRWYASSGNNVSYGGQGYVDKDGNYVPTEDEIRHMQMQAYNAYLVYMEAAKSQIRNPFAEIEKNKEGEKNKKKVGPTKKVFVVDSKNKRKSNGPSSAGPSNVSAEKLISLKVKQQTEETDPDLIVFNEQMAAEDAKYQEYLKEQDAILAEHLKKMEDRKIEYEAKIREIQRAKAAEVERKRLIREEEERKRLEAERIERERIEEEERLERERQEAEEQKRLEEERLEQERKEELERQERLERERLIDEEKERVRALKRKMREEEGFKDEEYPEKDNNRMHEDQAFQHEGYHNHHGRDGHLDEEEQFRNARELEEATPSKRKKHRGDVNGDADEAVGDNETDRKVSRRQKRDDDNRRRKEKSSSSRSGGRHEKEREKEKERRRRHEEQSGKSSSSRRKEREKDRERRHRDRRSMRNPEDELHEVAVMGEVPIGDDVEALGPAEFNEEMAHAVGVALESHKKDIGDDEGGESRRGSSRRHSRKELEEKRRQRRRRRRSPSTTSSSGSSSSSSSSGSESDSGSGSSSSGSSSGSSSEESSGSETDARRRRHRRKDSSRSKREQISSRRSRHGGRSNGGGSRGDERSSRREAGGREEERDPRYQRHRRDSIGDIYDDAVGYDGYGNASGHASSQRGYYDDHHHRHHQQKPYQQHHGHEHGYDYEQDYHSGRSRYGASSSGRGQREYGDEGGYEAEDRRRGGGVDHHEARPRSRYNSGAGSGAGSVGEHGGVMGENLDIYG